MKLYDVEFSELELALVESAGELSPELEQRFDSFLQAGKDKIEAAAMVVRGFEMEAEACQQEAKRLGQRSASLEKNAARLKRLILCALDSAFAGKVKTPLFTIWVQTSAACVSFDLAPGVELSSLPESCVRVRRELASEAIKEMVKKGETLPDEIIVTELPGTRCLRIK
jgi:Siphovirus Gp157